MEHNLPADPDLDELPAELREHDGPLILTGIDEDRNVWDGQVTREQVASALADGRRLREAEETS